MYFQLTGTQVRVLGSMHLFSAATPRMPGWVSQAFEWAQTLVFESDAQAILPFLKRDGGQSIEHALAPEVWSRLDASWPSAGALAPLGDLRPWAVMMAAPTLCQRVVEGVEPRLVRECDAQAKPYRFLETAQEVVASLESIPLPTICSGLEMLLADLTEPQRTLERMQSAWLQRDLQAVYSAESPMFSLPGMRNAILDARNAAWAPRVQEMLETPVRTLVVVGALHLHGAGNLIERLQCAAEPILCAG
jgi:uncharacterized protein YbaP (TraB family)